MKEGIKKGIDVLRKKIKKRKCKKGKEMTDGRIQREGEREKEKEKDILRKIKDGRIEETP